MEIYILVLTKLLTKLFTQIKTQNKNLEIKNTRYSIISST